MPIKSLYTYASLPNGNIVTSTPPLFLNNSSIINLAWYADLRYVAFNLQRGFNPPFSFTPYNYNVIAEPALLIDNYPVRKGMPFVFPVAF